jgi:excisionase family DNA binding protein
MGDVRVNEEPLLSIEEVADLLNVSTASVRRYLKDGLPYMRFGGRMLRFRRSDVHKWMADKEQAPMRV